MFRFCASGSSETSEQLTSTTFQPHAEVAGKGNAFVQEFYRLLHRCPQTIYHFYKERSRLGRPDPNGAMDSVTTIQAIKEKLLQTDYREFRAEIKTVDSQESLNGGLFVLVIGSLNREHSVKNFTQSFFLAPQSLLTLSFPAPQSFFLAPQNEEYFVLNDIFRYKHEDDHQLESNGLANELVDRLTLNEHDNLHLNSNSSSTSATLLHPPADEDAALTEAINASIISQL